MIEQRKSKSIYRRDIEMVEGTTRKEIFECVDGSDNPYDFSGFEAQTYVSLKESLGRSASEEVYLDTEIDGSTISFILPAAISVGKVEGEYETRIFKDDEVHSVVFGKIDFFKSPKPNLTKQ